LFILNLNTYESYRIDVQATVHDVAYADNFLFMSTYDGFRIWDISNLPSNFEVFSDSVYRSAGHLTLRDTILIEIYRDGDYKYKFWNISSPTQPQVIVQGDLYHTIYSINRISMTDQYVFCFDYSDAVYRLAYAPNDSLRYRGMLYEDYNDYDIADSLIYLINYDRFITVNVDDLSTHVTLINPWGQYTGSIIAVETYQDRLYLLVRNKGIEIYKRREQ
jgi:hypothetical protein